MDEQLPICDECGTVGAMLSGLHPSDAGIVRWTIYRCGHTRTEIVIEGVSTGDEPDLQSATLATD